MLSIETELNHNKPRKSVRSSFDMSANKSGEFKISKYPKSEDDRQKLLRALDSLFLFEHLQQHERLQLVDAFAPAAVERGHLIICEGDSENVQHLYVITGGSCTITKRNKHGVADVVHIARELECFGELALMYNAPRAATCKAVGAVKVWGVDRGTFKVILMDTTMKKRTLYKDFLQKVPILNSLTEYEQLTIADALVERTYTDGETVCTQGEPGDSFYIIRKGVASCTQQDGDGKVQEVARLEEGSYFGEIALLTQKPRQATVNAVDVLSVLSMDRKTFKRVMGPLVDILNRNIGGYNQFMQQGI